jgi:hypothetical protein
VRTLWHSKQTTPALKHVSESKLANFAKSHHPTWILCEAVVLKIEKVSGVWKTFHREPNLYSLQITMQILRVDFKNLDIRDQCVGNGIK